MNRRSGASRMLLLLASLNLVFAGCTWRSWYEGLRDQQRQECYQQSGQDRIQTCLDRVNAMTYDDYERLRRQRRDGTP